MRHTTLRTLVFLALSCALTLTASAQNLPLAIDTPVPGTDAYDASIPRPQDVIGHVIGERHTRPSQVVDYFEAVADASDRVTLERHGRTYDGRPLIHAFVTTPENHQRLDAIRQANVRLSDAPGEVSDADIEEMPAVTMMGYSIHGDEASGTEAAVLLLYHLAAGSGPDVDAVLNNSVVIIDPMFNPDGRNRFVDWVNGNRGEAATTDPQDREHNQPWPGGRTNHYWFDLNRDWLPAQHPESQGRLGIFHTWRPQVLTDFHEMGSEATYFFQPGIPSRTNPNTPERNQTLTARIADYHADYLNDIGSLYYTRESFDDFYYGKGSTYPDINGAVGILFEQASSRSLKTETDEGVLTYPFTVRNQFMTSLSTLKAVSEIRTDLLRHQRDFYANRADELDDVDTRAYVIDLSERKTRAEALGQLLRRHRVRMYDLAQEVEAGGRTYRPGEAYIVPLDQEQGRFIKAAMERTTTFPDSLFYDVSTWTLPLAFGVHYAELDRAPSNLRGQELDMSAFSPGQVVGGRAEYAYILPWGHYFTPRAVYRLQDKNIYPRLMTEGFTARVDGQPRSFDRGAVIVPLQQREAPADTVHAVVQRIVQQDFIDAYATDGGLTPSGPDLGSRGSAVLEKPEIALVTGTGGGSRYSGASAYNAGEVWHLLSERFLIPVSLVDMNRMDDVDLNEYNTMILAGGDYDALPADTIEQWVQNGGRLITLEDAADWVVENEMVELEEKEELDLDSLFQEVPYADLPDAYGAQGIGGTIFQAEVDPTHPIAYGYDETVPVFRSGTTFYEPSSEPGASVGVYSEDEPRLSGYVSEEVMDLARGSASIEAHEVGRGKIVMFMDNPNFRAFWYGTNGLFLNAIFLSGLL